MFGYKIDLKKIVSSARTSLAPHWRTWAGAFFVALAAASINYDEVVAPHVSKISQSWNGVALDMGRKLSSLTL